MKSCIWQDRYATIMCATLFGGVSFEIKASTPRRIFVTRCIASRFQAAFRFLPRLLRIARVEST